MEMVIPKLYVTDFSIKSCLEYVEQINTIVTTYGTQQPILVHIESPGGSVHGLAIIYDALKALENPIITYTSGIALSAGAFLFINATTKENRVIGENALLMLHEVQSGAIGDIKELREEMKLTEKINEHWMNLTAKNLGLNNSNDLKKLMRDNSESNEWYLDAHETVRLGFAQIVGTAKLEPFSGFNIGVVPPVTEQQEIPPEELFQAHPKKKAKKKGKKK